MFPIINIQRIPKTADGHIIYPGMPVFICSPYTTKKSYAATVYCVGDGVFSETNDYECVLTEKRFFDGEHWGNGNTEHVKVLYADETECLRVAHDKYKIFLEEQKARDSRKKRNI